MKKMHTFLAGAYAFALVMAVVETIRGNFPLWGWVFSPLTIYHSTSLEDFAGACGATD